MHILEAAYGLAKLHENIPVGVAPLLHLVHGAIGKFLVGGELSK